MSDDLYAVKPQHLLYECGEFRVELTANCSDFAFSSMVRGVMEPIMQPSAVLTFPSKISDEEATRIRREWEKTWWQR